MKRDAGIQDYVIERMNRLLTTLAFQVHRAAKKPGAEEIHDLRVSIRRFLQGLLLFTEMFPNWEVKKIKRMLKRMMQLTSEIRNRDIALEYLATETGRAHCERLRKERSVFQRRFAEMVRRWNARDFSAKWRNALSLRGV
ncbi:MAG TPA: CHAD domain-containing protein [Bryobacteraceae bacterium]|nr:CHAD domain-containing protein [Bryobacteraceae bacterium]